jgi:hypothetical protein
VSPRLALARLRNAMLRNDAGECRLAFGKRLDMGLYAI